MKFKKLFIALIMIAASLSLASCSNTDNPDDSGNTNTEVTYPYMDYLEQKVYAKKPDEQVYPSMLNSKNFTAIGTTTLDEITKTAKVDFGGQYNALVFTAKPNVEIVSVTFTISTKKNVFLRPSLYGWYKSGDKNDLVSKSSGVVDKITANSSKTYTLTTYNEKVPADFGIYDESFSEWERKIAIDFVTFENKEEQYGDGKYGQNEALDFVKQEYGIEIYNVSFNCKKIS